MAARLCFGLEGQCSRIDPKSVATTGALFAGYGTLCRLPQVQCPGAGDQLFALRLSFMKCSNVEKVISGFETTPAERKRLR